MPPAIFVTNFSACVVEIYVKYLYVSVSIPSELDTAWVNLGCKLLGKCETSRKLPVKITLLASQLQLSCMYMTHWLQRALFEAIDNTSILQIIVDHATFSLAKWKPQTKTWKTTTFQYCYWYSCYRSSTTDLHAKRPIGYRSWTVLLRLCDSFKLNLDILK